MFGSDVYVLFLVLSVLVLGLWELLLSSSDIVRVDVDLVEGVG